LSLFTDKTDFSRNIIIILPPFDCPLPQILHLFIPVFDIVHTRYPKLLSLDAHFTKYLIKNQSIIFLKFFAGSQFQTFALNCFIQLTKNRAFMVAFLFCRRYTYKKPNSNVKRGKLMMKKYLLITALMIIVSPTAASAQPPAEPPKPTPQDIERELDLRQRQLEIERQETELDFQRRMKDIELDERAAKLQRPKAPKPIRPSQRSGFRPCPRCCGCPVLMLVAVLCFIVNILLAVWVFQDIRKRNRGSGIWVVIALLTGLCGTLVYAIVRLRDPE
jgi:hypothetical protein